MYRFAKWSTFRYEISKLPTKTRPCKNKKRPFRCQTVGVQVTKKTVNEMQMPLEQNKNQSTLGNGRLAQRLCKPFVWNMGWKERNTTPRRQCGNWKSRRLPQNTHATKQKVCLPTKTTVHKKVSVDKDCWNHTHIIQQLAKSSICVAKQA